MSRLDPSNPEYPSIVANAFKRYGEIHVELTAIEHEGGAQSVEESLLEQGLRQEKQSLEENIGLDKLCP